MFVLQHHSNFGSGTPAVARTTIQGSQLLEFLDCSNQTREQALSLLNDLQRHLLRCVEVRNCLAAEVEQGLASFERKSANNEKSVLTIPGVADIAGRTESFLQSTKLAVGICGNLFAPFYSKHFNHRFDKLRKWCDETFGNNDRLAVALHTWKPFVDRILNMRNCVDHPESEPGAPLVIANIRLEPMSADGQLVPPTWNLTNEIPQPLIPAMSQIIEGIIQLSEVILLGLYFRHRASEILIIEEIPENLRDPVKPVRFRVTVPT